MPVDFTGTKPEEEKFPVARLARTRPLVITGPNIEDAGVRLFTLEAVKGLASSLVLHGLLLLILAFWYFSPKPPPAKPIDTRLMGSEMGVDDGLTITGGLNTPLAMLEPLDEPPVPTLTALEPLDLTPPERKNPSGAEVPSAEGGMDSDNPGAGEGDGFGLARFGQGGETIRGVEVKVGDPQFTLIWDSEADLDLHVIEPGGKEIYWEEPRGRHGGELDVDNTKGYGPENIYWLQDPDATGDARVKGAGPPGEYQWFVVYWGGFGGIARPTRWKVRIKHDDKVTIVTGRFRALNERSRVYTLRVAPRGGLAGEVKEAR